MDAFKKLLEIAFETRNTFTRQSAGCQYLSVFREVTLVKIRIAVPALERRRGDLS
jgi:hypothetical protein